MSNNDSNLVSTIKDLKEESIEGGIGMCDVIQRWVDEGIQQKAVEDAVMLVKEYKEEPKIAAIKMKAPLELVLESLEHK